MQPAPLPQGEVEGPQMAPNFIGQPRIRGEEREADLQGRAICRRRPGAPSAHGRANAELGVVLGKVDPSGQHRSPFIRAMWQVDERPARLCARRASRGWITQSHADAKAILLVKVSLFPSTVRLVSSGARILCKKRTPSLCNRATCAGWLGASSLFSAAKERLTAMGGVSCEIERGIKAER